MDKFSNRLYLCVIDIPSLFLKRKSFYILFFLEHFYDISLCTVILFLLYIKSVLIYVGKVTNSRL